MVPEREAASSVDLFWLPLGAGGVRLVRWSGRAFEALVAASENRERRDLYHSALEVHVDGERYVVEMGPAWGNHEPYRGVVVQGPVWRPRWGRSRLFRYEVRCWRNGVIPDRAEAVESPRRVSADRHRARRLLDAVPLFPASAWGRDDTGTGDMWNSNSLVSWLLAVSGHDVAAVVPPLHGRAPGWSAGLAVAAGRPSPVTSAAS